MKYSPTKYQKELLKQFRKKRTKVVYSPMAAYRRWVSEILSFENVMKMEEGQSMAFVSPNKIVTVKCVEVKNYE